jgi:hypothetical protein
MKRPLGIAQGVTGYLNRAFSAMLLVVSAMLFLWGVHLMIHPGNEERFVDVLWLLSGALALTSGFLSFMRAWFGWKAPWDR